MTVVTLHLSAVVFRDEDVKGHRHYRRPGGRPSKDGTVVHLIIEPVQFALNGD